MEENDRRSEPTAGSGDSSASEGEAEDFDQLWKRHQRELYRLCLSWMRGRHADAEEAFGNASMIALIRFKEIGDQLKNPRAWLIRVFRNTCMDLHRKRRRQRELALPDLGEEEASRALAEIAVSRTPQQRYLEREQGRYLRQAIRSLRPRLRVPLVLRFFMQMSYQEIAADLGITEENVRKRIQQARQTLAESLGSYRSGGRGQEARLDTPEALEREWLYEAEQARARGEPEIEPETGTLRAVPLRLPSGGVRYALIFAGHAGERRPEAKLPGLMRYVEEHPGGWKKRLEMAQALYAAGRWEEAIAQYRLALAKRPALLQSWLRLGRMLHLLGRDTEAAEACERALAGARREATRWHLRGWIALCRGDMRGAVQGLGAAAALEPAEPAHRLALARAHRERDRTAEALEALDEVLRIDPDNLPALIESHEALLAAGRLREAGRRAARALELDAGNFVAAERLAALRIGRRLVSEGGGAETRDLLRRAARQAPGWPDITASLALFHWLRGQQARAELDLKIYLDDHPECARGWMLSARIRRQAGQHESAAAEAVRALALDPADLEIRLEACEALALAGRRDEARRVRVEMLLDFPESWRAWRAEGAALLSEGAAELAAEASLRAVQLQPDLASAWRAHGEVLLRSGRFREALAAFESGWARLPRGDGFAEARRIATGLAEACLRLGEEERSAEWRGRAAVAAGRAEDDLVAAACPRV